MKLSNEWNPFFKQKKTIDVDPEQGWKLFIKRSCLYFAKTMNGNDIKEKELYVNFDLIHQLQIILGNQLQKLKMYCGREINSLINNRQSWIPVYRLPSTTAFQDLKILLVGFFWQTDMLLIFFYLNGSLIIEEQNWIVRH